MPCLLTTNPLRISKRILRISRKISKLQNIEQATLVLHKYKTEIVGDIAESKKEIGKELVDKLMLGLQDFKTIIADNDRDAIASKQKELLAIVGD